MIYARGFGIRQLGLNDSVNPDTLFQIGSTTKAFTTAALALLVDQAKIRFDDPVIKYLPDYQLSDPWVTRHLTIRDAVTYRSGIVDDVLPFVEIMSSEETIRHLRHAASMGASQTALLQQLDVRAGREAHRGCNRYESG